MSLLSSLVALFEGNHPSAPQSNQAHPAPRSVPDITYNPNPNTNIPYSAHSVADARLGNQYVANPTSPQFRNVDPARFGFPPDNSGAMRMQGSVQNQLPMYSQGIGIQGAQNPGFTPMQNSGFGGPGYAANLQPAQYQVQTPQVKIQ